MPSRARLGVLMLSVWATVAHAHPQGFHKKVVFTLTRHAMKAVMVMDIDGGERCSLIRSGADVNHDGLLSADETAALKKRLVAMAMKLLKVSVSGAPVALEITESKINLHADARVNESGLSVALLLSRAQLPAATPGMAFEFEDTAPDLSTVNLQVFQVSAPDAGVAAPFEGDIESGRRVSVRLSALAEER